VSIGVNRLIDDLVDLGFNVSVIKDGADVNYAVISNFEIPAGSFSGKIIDLAIPAPDQYPQLFGASIHLKSDPHLLPFGQIPGVRNVIASNLGPVWQYWSYQFNVLPNNPSAQLISQINEIFRKN
jgi:hypothetical protein